MTSEDPHRETFTAGRAVPGLAVVVPTYKEAANVGPLVAKLAAVLGNPATWELIFVDDDSPDGTADVIAALSGDYPNVRCLRRVGRRGLSSAVVEGCLSTFAPAIAVMDADLQHDETVLPALLAKLAEGYDVAVGSRYVPGGGTGEWASNRKRLSRLATDLTRRTLRVSLSDPMSGFFVMRREVFLRAVHGLSATGYKILLDILASSPEPVRVAEVPFTFRPRQAGESKIDSLVVAECLVLLVDKRLGGVVPFRFLLYSAMGTIGIFVHLALLALGANVLHLPFARAQTGATLVTVLFNFALNNQLTYRDRRLHGGRLLRGLLAYVLICSVGAASNIAVGRELFAETQRWLLSGLLGALVSAVFNYSLATQFVWSGRRPTPRRSVAAGALP